MKLKIEFAPREALGFLRCIEDVFLALVLDVNAWVSDESSLLEFLGSDDPKFAARPGTKLGYFVFRRAKPQRFNLREGCLRELGEREWEYEEVEEKGVDHTAVIVRRTKFYFGVDIAPVFAANFPVIFRYISEKMPPKYRAALAPGGWVEKRLNHHRTNPHRIVSTYWPTSPGFSFRIDEYGDGRCVTYYKRRKSGGRFRRLREDLAFNTAVMRPQLDSWLRSCGELTMNPWGSDDPRNVEKKKRLATEQLESARLGEDDD